MANKRRKRSAAAQEAMPSSTGPRRVDSGVEEAENGFIVRVCSDNLGKRKRGESGYKTRTFIAPTHEEAMRISMHGLQALGSKVKHKKGSRKRVAKKG
ncbi:MAG TPA: hypothetical protein VFW94_24335 [Candidatus Acidoferrales bacterium]|nr:hypothetical protein [Candidatus Acidoferrales bacterium]